MKKTCIALILVLLLSTAYGEDSVQITPETGIETELIETNLQTLIIKQSNWDDSMACREVRPQMDEMMFPPPYTFGYEQDLYRTYLETNNEPQRLKSWDKWGYLSKFYYDTNDALRVIEHYNPSDRKYWKKCEAFFYKDGKLSEQYLFEQWPHSNGKWSFRRNKFISIHTGDTTTIEYYTGSNTKWATETRFYGTNHLLSKITKEFVEKWRNPKPLIISLLYYDQGLLKEWKNDWAQDAVTKYSVTFYEYNQNGQMIKATNADGREREERDYTDDGTIVQRFYSPRYESMKPSRRTTLHDKYGHPTTIEYGNNSKWTFSYEPNPNYKHKKE